jgi:UDP-N-acetylglucosamine--N-acetylmuramyl-(pentapeptide) pyrophosphoryl-undecaprenol N-acetylglucosamine transferase
MATVVFAGGGTAGHIQPALAVARQWKKIHPSDKCLFIGTVKGLEATLIPEAGFELKMIPKVAIARRPSISWLKIPFALLSSILSCRKILSESDLLIGFGGYVSAPAYLAARSLRIPIVIHEANAKPGWANKVGAALTPHLAVAHSVESGKFARALLVGLPLRSDVASAYENAKKDWVLARAEAKARLGIELKVPFVFVMGGSQGSVAINTVIAECMELFQENGFYVLHSVGRLNQLPTSLDGYEAVSYVDQMADVYLAADLIIGRSGAVTCSEFRTLGRYALFVPLPIGNGEQLVNAASLVSAGRARVIDQKLFNAQYINDNITKLMLESSQSPESGSGEDLMAAEKIVALAEFALKK